MTAAPVSTSAGFEGAEAAANDLYEQYHDRIYAFCLSRTRNPTDAEDATQTAFMNALNGLRRGVVPRFELTWLLRIAENVCHSMHRRAYRRYERDELPAEVVSGQEDIALVTERFDALCLALESLPDQQRRAILLREWRGLSYDDIADELGVTHAAVETTLFRARRRLVKQLGSLAVFPFPSLGRVAQWLGGAAGAKATAAAVVAVGAATAVVSSAPVQDPRPVRLEPTVGSPTATHDVPAPPASATSPVRAESVRATTTPGSPIPAEPRVGEPAAAGSAPESPAGPPAELPTTAAPDLPAGVVEAPSVLPVPAVPVDLQLPAPVVELTESIEEALPIDLPPLPPLPPLVPLPPVVTGLPLP